MQDGSYVRTEMVESRKEFWVMLFVLCGSTLLAAAFLSLKWVVAIAGVGIISVLLDIKRAIAVSYVIQVRDLERRIERDARLE